MARAQKPQTAAAAAPAAAPRMVVALGGNAISRPGEGGTLAEQSANIERATGAVVAALRAGFAPIVTHGNGPQVGQMLLMVEAARGRVPELPLGVCVADTEGSLGYLIQQSLRNRLRGESPPRPVVTLVTQVVVDPADPAFERPSKPIGPFLSRAEAEHLHAEQGFAIVDDAGRGFRRVVASPRPLRVVEAEVVARLCELGVVPIAAGGGGVPVVEEADGRLRGVDAVVDKDLASAVLARDVGAGFLALLTDEPAVFVDYGQPTQRRLPTLSPAAARRHLAEGQFPPGSMGPKIEAALAFIEAGGREVLVTSIEGLAAALAGADVGTRLVADGAVARVAPPDAAGLAAEVADRTGLSESQAGRLLCTALDVLGEVLTLDEARAVAEALPEGLRPIVVGAAHRLLAGVHDLGLRAAALEGVREPLALEQVEVVWGALGRLMRGELAALLAHRLPPDIARLVLGVPREIPDVAAPGPQPLGDGRTLATGRSGSRSPLCESAPEPQSGSVAARPDPHAEHKLSSATAATEAEREGTTLATGRPGSRHPLAGA